MLKRRNPIVFLKDLLYSIYFNFHYLPFRQAVRLPILFHNPTFVNLKGKVRIEGKVARGMIKLGYYFHGGYPDGGFMFENNGGHVVFKGSVCIGGNSSFSVGKYGLLEIEGPTGSIEGLKIACYHHIKLENHCRIGWDVMMMDTSFLKLNFLLENLDFINGNK